MQPKKPFLWFSIYTPILFVWFYFIQNEPIIASVVIAVLAGITALGVFYGIEKIRKKWFAEKSDN